MPDFKYLEKVASEVIQLLQKIPEFAEFRIVVIGGLAVQKHILARRETQDIDFLVTVPLAPKSIQGRLLKQLPGSPFELYPQRFVYRASRNSEVTINMIPDWQVPYIPSSAVQISTIPPGEVPYIGLRDLLVLKIWSCGLRYWNDRKGKDVKDIIHLVDATGPDGPVMFSETQRLRVSEGVGELVNHEGVTTIWLQDKLGCRVTLSLD